MKNCLDCTLNLFSDHTFPMCGPKQKIYVSHERFHSLENKCKKKKIPMPLHQMDIDGFKSDPFLLPYGTLESMVINFTCDFSLVCIPPR